MTTNTTLEDIKREGRDMFRFRIAQLTHVAVEDVPSLKKYDPFIDSFAEKVWNAALDACREKMPGRTNESGNFVENRKGRNEYRKEASSAIDSLRT